MRVEVAIIIAAVTNSRSATPVVLNPVATFCPTDGFRPRSSADGKSVAEAAAAANFVNMFFECLNSKTESEQSKKGQMRPECYLLNIQS